MKPLRIVLSGKMSQTRDQMYRRFENYGIQVHNTVTRVTDYLVTGDRLGASKKAAAILKEVPILTEQEFIEMMIEKYPEYML